MNYKVIIGHLGIGGDIHECGDVVDLDPKSYMVETLLAAGDISPVAEIKEVTVVEDGGDATPTAPPVTESKKDKKKRGRRG